MVNVYAWPPVFTVGHSTRRTRPGSVSLGLNGAPYYSQAQAARETFQVSVHAVGPTLDGAGAIDMLHRYLDGQLALVRISPIPPLWVGAWMPLDGLRGAESLTWFADGRTLDWDAVWTTGAAISAVAEADGSFDAIRCTGLPPSIVVAMPGELVRGEAGGTARVVRRETSDASGEAVIRLDQAIPSGQVIIGARESLVMRITEWPEAGLELRPGGSLNFKMVETLASDFSSLTDIDPWN